MAHSTSLQVCRLTHPSSVLFCPYICCSQCHLSYESCLFGNCSVMQTYCVLPKTGKRSEGCLSAGWTSVSSLTWGLMTKSCTFIWEQWGLNGYLNHPYSYSMLLLIVCVMFLLLLVNHPRNLWAVSVVSAGSCRRQMCLRFSFLSVNTSHH